MAQLGQLGIGVNLDLSKFEGNITGLKRSMRDVDSTMKASMSSFGGLEKSVGSLGEKYDGLKKKQEIQTKIVEEQRKKYEELAEANGENSREAQNARIELNKQVETLNKLDGELTEVSSEMKELQRENSKVTQSFKALEGVVGDTSEKLKDIGKGMKDLGKGMTKSITVPLMGVLGASVKVGMSFESSMSNVKALTGSTGEEFEILEAKAREMGETTSKSATEAADAMGYMALAGWDNKQIMEGIEPVLRLSEATNMDLALASDLVTDSMSALGIEVGDLDGYLDSLAKTQSQANTDAESLMNAYLAVGGSFKNLNVPLEESNAILGIMANRGIKGAEAGNSLSSIMVNLTSGAGQAGVALEELGISAFDGEGNFKGLEAVLMEVKDKTSDLTEEQKTQYLSMIAGKTQLSGMNAILDGLSNEYGTLKESVSDADGAMMDLVNTMKDNLEGKLDILKSGLEGVGISIYKEVLPHLESLVEYITKGVEWFNELDDSTKGTIIRFGAVAGAIGPLLVALGSFVGIVGMALKPLAGLFGLLGGKGVGGLLGLLGKRFLFLLGPIGAIVGGFFLFKDILTGLGLDGIMEKFKELGNVIKGLFTKDDEDSEAGGFLEKLGITPEMVEKIQSVMGTIKENIETVAGVFVENLMPIIKEAIDWLKGLFENLRTFWDENGEGILTVIEKIHTFITGVLVTALPIVFAVIKSVFDNIKGFLGGAFEAIGGIIKLIVGVFTGDFSKMWEGVKSIFFGAFDLIWNGMQLLFFGKLVKGVAGLVKAVVGSFKSLWTRSIGIFKSLWNGVVQIFKDLVSGVTGKVTQLRTGIVNGITRARDRAVAVLRNLKDRAKGIFDDMVQFAKDLPGKIGKAIKNGAKSAVDGIISLGNKMVGKLGDVVNGVIGGMNNVTAKLGIEAKVEKWEVPQFSTGTKRGGHAGGLMTVGDHGPGNSALGKTRELVQYPNGLVQLFEKETTINAPKGTQVLSNRDTEKVLDAPRYSKGTEGAGGLLGKAKDFVGNVKDKLTGAIGNVWDAIKNPGNLINKIIDTLGLKIQGLTKFPLDLAKGAFGKIKEGFKGFLTNAREKATPESNLGALLAGHKINWAYGKYPFAFNGGNHYGIDTDHVYDPVRAAMGGKVRRYFFDTYGGGNTLEIQSGKIYQWYAHLSDSLVKAGDTIKAGQKIAISGNTGTNSTGPHLHYQLFRNLANPNGSSFDPVPYLKGKGAGAGGGAFDYFTGGLINDEGFYRLAEKGSELVVPTDDKTAMVKMLHYLNDLIGNDGSGNKRTSQIPTPKSSGGNGDDSLMREQNEMLREMISMMKEARNRDKEDLELARRRNEVLEGVLEKDFGVVLDGRKVSKQLYPHIKKESDRDSNKDWRLGRA